MMREAAPIKAMCALAVKQAFVASIGPTFQADTGLEIDFSWDPTTLLVRRIEAGETGDIIVAIDDAMNDFEAKGLLAPESRFPLASAYLGIAVKQGAPLPDVSSLDAFCRALSETRGVAVSKAGASGIYFRKMMQDLGITAEVLPRIVPIESGFTATKLIDGAAELAVQQVSELMTVDGVAIAGPFPEEVQTYTHFSVAAFRDSENPEGARAFIDALRQRSSQAALAAGGLKPRNEEI